MIRLRSTGERERCHRWHERAAWLGWGTALLLAFSVLLVLLEQVASGFYYLDQPDLAHALAVFAGDVMWLFMIFGSTFVCGLITVVALVWLVAYTSVRCEEFREGRTAR